MWRLTAKGRRRLARWAADDPEPDAAEMGFDRDDPEASVVNVPTLGYTEMELILTRSTDRGRTWSSAKRIEPPLVGPAFEVCHSVTELRDGRWVWPTSTWMIWPPAAIS